MKIKRIIAMLLSVCMMFSVTFADSPMDGIKNIVEKAVMDIPAKLTELSQDIVGLKKYVKGLFKDYNDTEWYAEYVAKLVGIGGIKGYDDGTFRPSGTITQAEFVAMLCRSIGVKPKEVTGGHWSAGIMAAAQEAGIVKTGELVSIDAPISRFDMARLVVRAIEYRQEPVPADWADYTSVLYDLNTAPAAYKDSVIKSVAMGIITGYTDKNFSGTKTLSRAEASVVVIRVLDPAIRKVPAKPSPVGQIKLGETKPLSDILPKDYSKLEFIDFGYKTVTLADSASLYPLTYTTSVGTTGVKVKGHQGTMMWIKNSEVVDTCPELWSPSTGYSLYASDYWDSADYIGFFAWGESSLKIYVNPFKK